MKKQNTRRGFTLIELLVVVLIIGILAAVALPQYQIAVMKSRLTQAYVFSSKLREAEQRYYLTNGTYTLDISELDIDLPSCSVDTDVEAASTGEHVYYNCANQVRLRLYRNIGAWSVYTYINRNESESMFVEYYIDRKGGMCGSNYALGKKMCLSIGVEHATYGSTTYYKLKV